MRSASRLPILLVGSVILIAASGASDWPQWRGPNRDGKTADFQAPQNWPAQLTQKWSVTVGDGVATPALVDDRLYVFSRQEGNEILRCLDVESGQEQWKSEYPAGTVRGPAGGFAGPRSSPAVTDGKVVTLGVQGVLTCFDAATGDAVWKKEDFTGSLPRFYPSSSPIIVDGLCIAQLGGDGEGGIVAIDLASGDEKWRWTGDSPAYGSPTLINLSGGKAIVTPTDKNMVAVDVANGRLLWQIPYSQGRYNAASPMIVGLTIVYAGPTRGTTAEAIKMQGDKLVTETLWSNADNSVIYNTPVVNDGFLYGLSNANALFCIDTQNGQTTWTAPISAGGEDEGREQEQPARGARRGRGRRGGGGRGGYGSIVNAGSVLFALTPAAELVAFEANGMEYKELARYKVADGGTHAYPVIAGNDIFIKDQESITRWTLE